MNKIIRLSRYKFDKCHIQHNVTFSVSGIFDKEEDMTEERIRIMTILLESLFPNTITIVSVAVSERPLTEYEKSLKALDLHKRKDSFSEGDEISMDDIRDIMLYCYAEGLDIELEIIDIKNQHVTMVINRGIFGYHYIYGTPETFTKEYLSTIKKKLKDCTFDGSFRKTL